MVTITANEVADPQGPAQGAGRVLRGGSWDHRPRSCRSTHRGRYSPDGRRNRFGFRVVLAVPANDASRGR